MSKKNLCSRLSKNIKIEIRKEFSDGAGGVEYVWQELLATKAEIRDVHDRRIGYEQFSDLQMMNEKYYYVTIRYVKNLPKNAKLRIINDERIFEVCQIINENCENNWSLRFFVKEKNSQGKVEEHAR